MSEMDDNPSLRNINEELNRIFDEVEISKTVGGAPVSEIIDEVEVGNIGELLIENFNTMQDANMDQAKY